MNLFRFSVETDPPSKVFRAASLLLQRTIKDTIFSVFNLTIQTLILLMDDFSRKHRFVLTSAKYHSPNAVFPGHIAPYI